MNSDVVIIGGGIIGTACAYFLAGKGARVMDLERDHLACGATGSTAAIISVSGSASTPQALLPLSLESYNLILEHAHNFDPDIELAQDGALYAAMNDDEAAAIYPFYEEIWQMGIDCRIMDGPEARRLEPLLAERVTAAVFNPASFHVNPFHLSAAYLNSALREGGRVEYGVEVREIVTVSDRVEKVVTNRGDFRGEWVVIAGGANSPELLSSHGLQTT